jgi:hypothetical protein
MSVIVGTPAIQELLRASQVQGPAADDAALRTLDRAKVVVCVVDGRRMPALLPASLAVNLERLLSLAGAGEIRLEQDDERFAEFSSDTVFVDVRLALTPVIVFVTGTAEETVAIRWAEFARTMRPIVGDFAETSRDRVGGYRLSYRE